MQYQLCQSHLAVVKGKIKEIVLENLNHDVCLLINENRINLT